MRKFRFLLIPVLIATFGLASRPINAASPPHVWSKSLGSNGNDEAHGVGVDSNDDVFITGAFENSVNFGGGSLTSAGGLDIFLAKYEGIDGDHLWSKRIGSTSTDISSKLVVDGNGDVFVIGLFSGTVNFGGGSLTSAGGYEIFVAKYEGSDGDHLWSKRFGSTGNDRGYNVAVNSSGDIFVTGSFIGSVDFGGGSLTSAGNADLFLARYEGADGDHVWSKHFGASSNDTGYAVAIDDAGDVFLTGDFAGTVDFGGGSLASAGYGDIILAKYEGSDGDHVWSKRFGGTHVDRGQAVAVDEDDNVVLTGSFKLTVNFGGEDLVAAGEDPNDDIFVAKFAGANGNHTWSKRFGHALKRGGDEQGTAIATATNNSVVLLGQFYGEVDFGGGVLTMCDFVSPREGEMDMFIGGYTPEGNHLLSLSIGGCPGPPTSSDGWQLPNAVAVDSEGNLVVAGAFESPTDFGGGLYTPTGGSGPDEAFLFKYTFPAVTVADNQITACPEGDADDLVINLDFADAAVSGTISASSIVLDSPTGVEMFGDDPITADTDATSGNGYQTTITVSSIGGCALTAPGASFPIRVNGVRAGTAFVYVKSPDFDASGTVNSTDQSVFNASYGKCEGQGGYDPCADFIISGSPSCVSLADFSYWAFHNNHEASGPPLLTHEPTEVGGALAMNHDVVNRSGLSLELRDVEGASGGSVVLILDATSDLDRWEPASDRRVTSTTVLDGNTLRIFFVGETSGTISGELIELGRLVIRPEGDSADLGREPRFVSGFLTYGPGQVRRLVPAQSLSKNPADPHFQDRLMQNFPNPFNPTTQIKFSVARSGLVTLAVYGVGGELVRTLVNRHLPRGEHSVIWYGRDDKDQPVASGTYFCTFRTASHQDTRKLVLLK